ncbi:RNA-directed DNA polymerase [Abeliophyllum distichum]|uniref:RNA-directed DNA polymerase n=1 Tax=Abeliophyllum distichum TaxID=126358 RepID=A0ABD1NUS1_9LAMI
MNWILKNPNGEFGPAKQKVPFPSYPNPNGQNGLFSGPKASSPARVKDATMVNYQQRPFRRLSEAELQAKKEKGLCFKCDEKYTIGHRCKNKELQVLLVQEEGESYPNEEEIGEDYLGPTLETAEVGEVVELSLNSVVGLTPP